MTTFMNIVTFVGNLVKAFTLFRIVSDYIRSKPKKNPTISFPFQPDKDDNVQLMVWTFDKNRDKVTSPDMPWRHYDGFKIEPQDGYCQIHKSKIAQCLPKRSYPFKFFLRINENDKEKYFSRLVANRLIVTGKGDKDDDHPGKWRV